MNKERAVSFSPDDRYLSVYKLDQQDDADFVVVEVIGFMLLVEEREHGGFLNSVVSVSNHEDGLLDEDDSVSNFIGIIRKDRDIESQIRRIGNIKNDIAIKIEGIDSFKS